MAVVQGPPRRAGMITPSISARLNSRVIGCLLHSAADAHHRDEPASVLDVVGGGNSPRSSARWIRMRLTSIHGPIPAPVAASASRRRLWTATAGRSWPGCGSVVPRSLRGRIMAVMSPRRLPVSGSWSRSGVGAAHPRHSVEHQIGFGRPTPIDRRPGRASSRGDHVDGHAVIALTRPTRPAPRRG